MERNGTNMIPASSVGSAPSFNGGRGPVLLSKKDRTASCSVVALFVFFFQIFDVFEVQKCMREIEGMLVTSTRSCPQCGVSRGEHVRRWKHEDIPWLMKDPSVSCSNIFFAVQAAHRAALKTDNKGFDAALDWALAHSEDPDFNAPLEGDDDEEAGEDGDAGYFFSFALAQSLFNRKTMTTPLQLVRTCSRLTDSLPSREDSFPSSYLNIELKR